jgi:hypothetical protein
MPLGRPLLDMGSWLYPVEVRVTVTFPAMSFRLTYGGFICSQQDCISLHYEPELNQSLSKSCPLCWRLPYLFGEYSTQSSSPNFGSSFHSTKLSIYSSNMSSFEICLCIFTQNRYLEGKLTFSSLWYRHGLIYKERKSEEGLGVWNGWLEQ